MIEHAHTVYEETFSNNSFFDNNILHTRRP